MQETFKEAKDAAAGAQKPSGEAPQKSHADARKELEAKYQLDPAFNPLSSLRLEKMKHDEEIMNLKMKKANVMRMPLMNVADRDPVEAMRAEIGKQIISQQENANWFSEAEDAAKRGDTSKAEQHFRGVEQRIAENLRDAFDDEQAAREALQKVAGLETHQIKDLTDRYSAKAQELGAQRSKLKRVQDQIKYLQTLAEEHRDKGSN